MLRRGAAASTYWAFTRRVCPRVGHRSVNGTPPTPRSWRSLPATAKKTQTNGERERPLGGFPVGHASDVGAASTTGWEADPTTCRQLWPTKGVQERGAGPAVGWGASSGGGEPRPTGRFWEGSLCCSGVLCFHAFLSSRRCRFPAARPWLTEGLSVSPQDTGPRTARRPRGSPAAPDPPAPSPSACPPDSSEPSEGRLLVVVASVLSKNSLRPERCSGPVCVASGGLRLCVPQGSSRPPCFSH